MVIHDMRNPSTSVEFSLKESLKMIRESLTDIRKFQRKLPNSIMESPKDTDDKKDSQRNSSIRASNFIKYGSEKGKNRGSQTNLLKK